MICEAAAPISLGLGKRCRSSRPATSVATYQISNNTRTVASPIKVRGFTTHQRLCAPDRLADHRIRAIGRAVAGPDNVLVGTNKDEARLVGIAAVAICVAYDLQGHAQRSRRLLERQDGLVLYGL